MEQRKTKYTTKYIENLPEDVRVELIDGELYDMATPTGTHQAVVGLLFNRVFNYIDQNHGNCQVFVAPYAVYLDEYNFFEPDITVVCDTNKLDNKGCHGAPDWIIEIISPSTSSRDYITKFSKYHDAGVRLYWIVNPLIKKVVVWYFERGYSVEYAFGEDIPVDIYPNFSISVPLNIGWER